MTGNKRLSEFYNRCRDNGEEYAYAQRLIAPPRERRQEAEGKESNYLGGFIGMEDH